MTFIPFGSKKTTRRPAADPVTEEKEEDAGQVAAHAIIQTFRGPGDWIRFYREHGSPSEYAERAFPPTLFTESARYGFIAFFCEIERRHRPRLSA